MPIYEYQCEACGHRFEQIQKFSDPLAEVCPKCGEPKLHKLVSSPAIQFKGSGWYINDYAKKGNTGTESSKTEGDAKKSDVAAAASPSTPSTSSSDSSSPSPTASPSSTASATSSGKDSK